MIEVDIIELNTDRARLIDQLIRWEARKAVHLHQVEMAAAQALIDKAKNRPVTLSRVREMQLARVEYETADRQVQRIRLRMGNP